MTMERTYTIPLRKAFLKTPKYVRTNRAVREVREYLRRHTKTEQVKLGEELNKVLWARGDAKPPSRVTVTAKKEEDVVYAELAGKEFRKKEFTQTEEKPQTAIDKLKAAATGKTTDAPTGKPEEPAALEAKPARAKTTPAKKAK